MGMWCDSDRRNQSICPVGTTIVWQMMLSSPLCCDSKSFFRVVGLSSRMLNSKPIFQRCGYATHNSTFSIFDVLVRLNSLLPNDAIRRHKLEPLLACLAAQSHYLHRCWLIIKSTLWKLIAQCFSTKVSVANTQSCISSCLWDEGTVALRISRHLHPILSSDHGVIFRDFTNLNTRRVVMSYIKCYLVLWNYRDFKYRNIKQLSMGGMNVFCAFTRAPHVP